MYLIYIVYFEFIWDCKMQYWWILSFHYLLSSSTQWLVFQRLKAWHKKLFFYVNKTEKNSNNTTDTGWCVQNISSSTAILIQKGNKLALKTAAMFSVALSRETDGASGWGVICPSTNLSIIDVAFEAGVVPSALIRWWRVRPDVSVLP